MLIHTRSIFITILISYALFTSVAYTACKKTPYTYTDACSGVECKNNGTCTDGKCYCTAGYTGDYCEKKAITPYIGKWALSQQVVASNNQASIGQTKYYEITISESAEGVTFFDVDGWLGDNTFNDVSARIGMMIGSVMVDSVAVEADVPAPSTSFVFRRYQALGKSVKQLVKGEGTINGIGTQITGEFYLNYPDSAKGAIEDRISFVASYIN